MAVDWAFIAEQEGARELKGYVPVASTSSSGVTIATGVDLGQQNAAGLAALGLSAGLLAKLTAYCGHKKQVAVDFLGANPLVITEDECTELDGAVRGHHLRHLMKRYDGAGPVRPFNQMPDRAQTVVTSVAFQYGDLPSRCPRFWLIAVRHNWADMIHELENFGDDYGPRRQREANYLRPVLTA